MADHNSPDGGDETRRQIVALWDGYHRLEQKIDTNTRETLNVAAQVPYMVALLERIDKTQCAQTPVCADRGARVVVLEKTVAEHECFDDRLHELESSNRVLKWVLGIVTTVLGVIGADKILKMLQ
jgi:hypothetical protein